MRAKLLLKKIAAPAFALVIIGWALNSLINVSNNISLDMLTAASALIPASHMFLSAAATVVSFSAMAGGEYVAVRSLHKSHLPVTAPILVGSVGNALANTIGLPAVTLTAWRFEVYSSLDYSLKDISKITGVAFLGILGGIVGIALLSILFLSAHTLLGVGQINRVAECIQLVAISGAIVWFCWKSRSIQSERWKYPLPSLRIVVPLLLFGVTDIASAIYAAYVLLPGDVMTGFSQFSLYYVMAVVLGIVSHAPGGIGVFEATIITELAANGRADVLVALLTYRLVYNLAPFGLACLTLAIRALSRRLV